MDASWFLFSTQNTVLDYEANNELGSVCNRIELKIPRTLNANANALFTNHNTLQRSTERWGQTQLFKNLPLRFKYHHNPSQATFQRSIEHSSSWELRNQHSHLSYRSPFVKIALFTKSTTRINRWRNDNLAFRTLVLTRNGETGEHHREPPTYHHPRFTRFIDW